MRMGRASFFLSKSLQIRKKKKIAFILHPILNSFYNIIQFHMGLRITSHIKSLLWKMDLFSSSQLLRYKTENSYSTLTGGFISLVILLIFGALLIQDSISVFTKSSVTAQDFVYYLEDPTYTSFSFDETTKFIMGVGITGYNLSNSKRYFDITLSTQTFQYGNLTQDIQHNMQPCQYEQWAKVNQIGANSYNSSQINAFLCPDPTIMVQLQGKYTSETFKLLRLRIGKCKNATDPSRPCEDEQKIDKTLTYNVNYYFMNAYVNSGTLDPVGYYLQDRNYFGFTMNSTIVSNIYLSQNIINTDDSLFPWENTQTSTVLLVKELAQVKNGMNIQDQYLSIYLRKSPYYILSQRIFQKLQDLFSNLGGLFGFAIFIFFFMQFYTQAAFQIEMADHLFYYKADEPLNSNGFNFFFYLIYVVYEKLCHLGLQIPWDRMKRYREGRQQVGQQLDLSLLMNKITFLEKCMNVIFEEHQFRAIYLQQKPNVKQAETLRRNHGLNKIIHQNSKKINTKIQDKVKQHHEKLMKKTQNTDKRGAVKKGCKVCASSNEGASKQSQERPYDLMQIVTQFIKKDIEVMKDQVKQKQQEKIPSEQPEIVSSQMLSQKIEVQQFTGQTPDKLQFINTALQDIKKLQKDSSQGNMFSQRIYNQLNNDITKQQLMVLKLLQTVMTNKSLSEIGQDVNAQARGPYDSLKTAKSSTKRNMFKDLLRLTRQIQDQNRKQDKQKEKGLEIVLESNNRLVRNNDFL